MKKNECFRAAAVSAAILLAAWTPLQACAQEETAVQTEDSSEAGKDAKGAKALFDELLSKSSLLADFRAVKEGNVWCTGQNLFQETMGLGNMIVDIHKVLTEDQPDEGALTYLHRVENE